MNNLTPDLNQIIELNQDPLETIDLQEVTVGENIIIRLGEESSQRTLVFQIVKPAGPGWGVDAAEAVVIDCSFQPEDEPSFRKFNFPFPPIGLKTFLVGSCTKNVEAPLGCTMISVHKITRGRHFIWTMPKQKNKNSGEVTWIFPEIITNISIDFSSINECLEGEKK